MYIIVYIFICFQAFCFMQIGAFGVIVFATILSLTRRSVVSDNLKVQL